MTSNVFGFGGYCNTSLVSMLITKPKFFERIDNSFSANWDISQAVTFSLLFARHIELDPYPQAKSRAIPFEGKRCWLKKELLREGQAFLY